jgi:hypothetical protein
MCNPGLIYCLAPGQQAPTSCDGQKQQQQQQQQESTNVNNNRATGGTAISSSSANGGSGGQGGQGGNATGGSSSVGNTTSTSGVANAGNNTGNGGGAKVTVEGDKVEAQARNPVNSATAAPPIIINNDNCRTGWGVGAQGVTLGFTVSGTAVDTNCELLKLNRELVILGHKDVAIELLRGDERVEAAFKRVENKDKRDERGRKIIGYVEAHENWQATTLSTSDHGN